MNSLTIPSDLARQLVSNAKAAMEQLNTSMNTEGTLNALINAQALVFAKAVEAAGKLDTIDRAYELESIPQQEPKLAHSYVTGPPPTDPVFTPKAQQVLALAAKETKRLGITYVGTEQLLVGILKLGEGNPAYDALVSSGANVEMLAKHLSYA